jgi:DNA-binding MarR family transcriptional regulator
VTRHYDQYLAGTGLKNTQYSLLSYLVALGPIKPNELARHMQMDASTLTRNMQALIAQGWATTSSGDDARSRLLQATQAGRSKRAEGQRAWKKAQLALNARLGEERVAAMHDLLDDCIESLQHDAQDAP